MTIMDRAAKLADEILATLARGEHLAAHELALRIAAEIEAAVEADRNTRGA